MDENKLRDAIKKAVRRSAEYGTASPGVRQAILDIEAAFVVERQPGKRESRGLYNDWDILVYAYAQRQAEIEMRRAREEYQRKPTDNSAAVLGHYMGVLHRIRLMVYDRMTELDFE